MKKIITLFLVSLIFCLFFSCASEEVQDSSYVLNVICPTGAPQLSQTLVDYEKPSTKYLKSVNNTFVSGSDPLKAAFAGDDYDVIYAPINLGAIMYNNNQKYILSSVITFGNLYLALQSDSDFSISDLNNQKINFFGTGTVNEIVLKEVLKQNNVLVNFDESTAFNSTSETQANFLKNPTQISLIAEPSLTVVMNKLASNGINNIKVIDLQEEWQKATGFLYPQAGIFVKANQSEDFYQAFNDYLFLVKDGIEKVYSNPNYVSQAAISLGYTTISVNIFEQALLKCGIGYEKAVDIQDDVSSLFNIISSYNPKLIGGKTLNEEFYYQ